MVDLEKVGLSREDVVGIYRYMLLARRLDERQWVLNRSGKGPFVISCQGQEAAQVGAAWAFKPKHDFFLPYYRDLGVVLVAGATPRDIMLDFFAKPESISSGGRQMPGHFSNRKLNIVSQSSPVVVQLLHACGVAYAAKLRGEDTVAYTSFGEGSSSEGDFHEALNFAAIHKLPVVFFCENNGYAISVPLTKQTALPDIAARAQAYGIPGVTVDGNDPLAVFRVAKEAVNRARAGEGPTLIEAKVYRLTPHSSDDKDTTYRTREEVEQHRKNDPVPRFAEYLKAHGLATEEELAVLNKEIMAAVNEATDYAESAPEPDPKSVYERVFAEGAE